MKFAGLLIKDIRRESIINDLTKQRDALIQEVLELKRELKQRDSMLDELCQAFSKARQEYYDFLTEIKQDILQN